MKNKIEGYFYYLLLFFIGFFVYRFQIEKSFNLISIYFLSISFSFIAYVFNIEVKKTLPVLFLVSLFWLYGVRFEFGILVFHPQRFFILLAIVLLLLLVLLPTYSLKLKKLWFGLVMIGLASIYVIQGKGMSTFNYIPYVIGSFFMFRSISFLHELKFLKKPASLLDNLNYFLLSPNFSLPLFPIVDYKSFITSYQGICSSTLQKSTLFICRGIFQLLLYRIIYHHIIIPINEIHTTSQVVVYLAANFMIVLRVIGAFHIAIGLVILSGYNIPDLFNNIFFSTGFSNLWRRTNMYWKNFVIKIFYYPIYFKIKKIGIYAALFISTFICFFITWFLHTYQWFWIKGSFPIDLKDAIFWGSFGLLVSVNTLMQQKELDRSGKVKKAAPFYDVILFSFYGLIVFFVMSILWSIWTSNSLYRWLSVIALLKNINMHELLVCAALATAYIMVASVYHYYQKFKDTKLKSIQSKLNLFSYLGFIAMVLCIYAASLFAPSLGRSYLGYLIPIVDEKLNKADLINVDNGYYSNLISTNDYCSQVWQNDYDIARKWTQYNTMHMTRPTNNLLLVENIPNKTYTFRDVKYSMNADGMHDKPYSKSKPDSCYRIIILGGSYESGNGISDDHDFISIVEKQLNDNYVAEIDGVKKHIELLNFSVNGYMLMQRYFIYSQKVRQWNPDALFLFIHTTYYLRIVNYVNRLVSNGYEINDPYLRYVIKKTKISKDDDGGAVQNKLGYYADSINYYAAKGIGDIAHQDSVNLIAVFLPSLKDVCGARDSAFLHNVCAQNKMREINLAKVFAGYTDEALCLSDVDFHPNQKANNLIANKLLENIILHQDYFNIKFTKK